MSEWEFPSDRQDRELLSRHSPIVVYDDRELFFPFSVDAYLQHATLVVDETYYLPAGSVDEAALGRGSPGSYLRFISDQERRSVVREEARRMAGKMLGPRLGRVGLFGRILDALFLLSILIRPTTPRRTTVAAALKVAEHRLQQRPAVYGRVVETGGWLVLHYAYFYAMNDWRTGYGGLNDHEADWEQAWIFCDPVSHEPVWVAASNHEHVGADLRRHWDDPECRVKGNRPVLFAGAGSHAFYFRPGDYVTRIDIVAFRWLLRVQRWARRILRISDQAAERGLGPALGVPFVDSATGDGLQVENWDLHPLDASRPAFGRFSGLWGLDTGDPAGGERGPAGPKFDRSGGVRVSWADPVGFAGLHGVLPPSLSPGEANVEAIEWSLNYLDEEIQRTSRLLPPLEGIGGNAEFNQQSQQLTALLRQRVHLEDLAARLARGESIAPGIRSHLRHPAVPLSGPQESGWPLALWAASSVPLLMIAAASLLVTDGVELTTLLLSVAAGFSLLEQLVRRQFQAVLRLMGLYLCLFGLGVLLNAAYSGVVTVTGYAFGMMVTVAALLLFIANLGELSAVKRRAGKTEDHFGADDPRS